MSYRFRSTHQRNVCLSLPCLAAAIIAVAVFLSNSAERPALAQAVQDTTKSAADTTSADDDNTPPGQIDAKLLIGDSVEDADSPQYAKVTAAIDLFRQRRVKEARDLLTSLRVAQPKLPPAELLIAKLFILARQAQLAMQELELTVQKHPLDPEAFLILADGSLNERRVTAAEALYQKAQYLNGRFKENDKRKDNFDKRILFGLAAVNLSRQQWAAAETLLRSLLKLDPKSAGAYQRLATALFQQATPNNKKREDAYDAFTAAARLDPKAIKPDVAMGQLFEQAAQEAQTAGDKAKFNEYRQQATTYFERATKGSAADLNTFLAAATWALQTGQFKLARQYADAAMKKDPKSVQASFIAAVVARFMGDLDTAEKLLTEAWIDAPNSFPVSNQLALVLVESKDPQKQKRAYGLADNNAKMNQNNAEAASTLGWVLYRLDYKKEAGQVLDNVIKSGALSADSAYYVAFILADQDRNKDALQILDDALDQSQPFANRNNAESLRDKVRKELQASGTKDGKEATKATPSSTKSERSPTKSPPTRGKK
jgi:tetratricopeptide (TPR) repeat protein